MKFAMALMLAVTTLSSVGADKTLVIHVLDGKSGKPISNEHLIVFEGVSAEEVGKERNHIDLRTNAAGIAVLPIKEPSLAQIQVWVDFHVLCQKEPNARSYEVEDIMKTGTSMPNNCGKALARPEPGQFFVFVRRPGFWEKMRR
jgi:hypothetical protein